MKNLNKIIMSAVCGCLLLAPATMVAEIVENQTGLASPTSIVTFDDTTFAQGTLITNQYASEGVTFAGLTYDSQAISTCCNGINNNYVGTVVNSQIVNPFTISFTSVQDSVAFALATNPANTTFTAFLGATQVDSFTSPTDFNSSTPYYFGFSGEDFDSIEVNVTNSAALLDNIQMGSAAATPEPGTMVLMAVGLGTAILSRRRAAKQ
jgi:hypothetical protein